MSKLTRKEIRSIARILRDEARTLWDSYTYRNESEVEWPEKEWRTSRNAYAVRTAHRRHDKMIALAKRCEKAAS